MFPLVIPHIDTRWAVILLFRRRSPLSRFYLCHGSTNLLKGVPSILSFNPLTTYIINKDDGFVNSVPIVNQLDAIFKTIAKRLNEAASPLPGHERQTPTPWQ